MASQNTGHNNSFITEEKQNHTAEGMNGKNRRSKTVLLIGILAILLVIGAGSYFLFSSGIFSVGGQVTVSFDSTGGSEVESQFVPRGGKLPQVASPSRNGYVFAGWYYEEAPVHAYRADDVFNQNTTLYAEWYQPEMESYI